MKQSSPLAGGIFEKLRAVCTAPPSTLSVAVAVLLALLVFLASTGWIAWHRGIWYDEVWSLYFGHHDLGFWQALVDRWLKDNHPPSTR
ncbi:hypothetical protein G4G27_09110 [Sphingomonas sp. So64.6b]|uniref:hypothetical protein n=1 Tax=Sphingomonas sp. So64.6b TaxID=2997354 RepID=UPI001602D6F7|nr:hypothetical protein [Sphingomonas sp. So64.6b]QNA84128.1 hypothetical protein G4G27_09110 [Sphingomonas sp. So64.6b]